jgi:hypothetical protein
MRRLVPAALLITALLLAAPLWAEQIGTPATESGESQSLAADEEPPGWQFEFMPYAWAPGAFGSVRVKGRTADIDVTISDLLTVLWHGDAFAVGGYFAARYERWSAFVDAFGGFENVGSTVHIPTRACGCLQVGATADLRPVILDVALGYQLGEWSLPERRQPISLGVYLGTRYVYLGTTLNVEGGLLNGTQRARQVAASLNVAQPLIGVRWAVPLLDSLSLDFRSDLGGIPGNSQLTWGLVSDVRYGLGWAPFGSQTWLAAGYKVIAFQRDFGGGKAVDLQLRGPLLALGFTF